jgi:hypothetical protein
VRLPPAWIGRLLAPILADSSVASATPFSNAATICSFPVTDADNPPFADIPLARIDRHFRALDRRCAFRHADRGRFCMAMNRRFLDAIGLFDAQAFGRGYGGKTTGASRRSRLADAMSWRPTFMCRTSMAAPSPTPSGGR